MSELVEMPKLVRKKKNPFLKDWKPFMIFLLKKEKHEMIDGFNDWNKQ